MLSQPYPFPVRTNPALPPDTVVLMTTPSHDEIREMRGLSPQQRIDYLVRMRRIVVARGLK
jgi:hypothetical protein